MVLNILDTSNVIKIRAAIIKKPKTLAKKNKSKKIKIIIKIARISTKIIYMTKTLVIALVFHKLII